MNWKRWLLLTLVILALAVGLVWFWPGQNPQVLQLSGVVEIQEIRLGSKIGGRVERIAVEEGSVVEADSPLVYLSVPELEAQKEQCLARLIQAEAELERARAGPRPEEKRAAREAAEAAKSRWELMKAGMRQEEIREARSLLESAEAEHIMWRDKLKRAERLFAQGTITSREEVEATRAAHDSARANVAKAKSRLDLVLAGNRPEEIKHSEALFKQAQANLDLLLSGTRSEDIRLAEARVAEARGKLNEITANLNESVVRAPEKVLIEVLGVRKGDLVLPNQPVIRALRAADIWVKVYVPETDLGKVKLNRPVEVAIDSHPGRAFHGAILNIASESEFTPRNVQSANQRRHQVFGIKIRVADTEGIFKSGMAAMVTVPLD